MIYFKPHFTQELLNFFDNHFDAKKTYLIICNQQKEADELTPALRFYLNQAQVELFPDWETLPYDNFSPHQDIISKRLSILHALTLNTPMVLVLSIHTLLHFISPKAYLKRHAFCIEEKQVLKLDDFKRQLIASQYQVVSQVEEHGQFSSKGALIDVFPMGSAEAIRIEWFDDEIESLRYFDTQTQLSTQKIKNLQILPAKEYPFDEKAIALFRQQYREMFPGNPNQSVVYGQVSQGKMIQGLEYFLPLFFEQVGTLFDFLPKDLEIIPSPEIKTWIERFWHETEIRYEQRRYDVSRPLLSPQKLFLSLKDLHQHLNSYQNHHFKLTQVPKEVLHVEIERKSPHPFHALKTWLEKHSTPRVLLMASSLGRREVILDLCKASLIFPKVFDSLQSFEQSQERIGLTFGPFTQGLFIQKTQIVCLTEQELFNEPIVYQKPRKQAKQSPQDKFIKDLSELHIGMAVVHIEYGVGRYLGLQRFSHHGLENEFLMINYAGDDKIYVPVTHLNLISKYSSGDDEHAPIHKLGSETWQKEKKKLN